MNTYPLVAETSTGREEILLFPVGAKKHGLGFTVPGEYAVPAELSWPYYSHGIRSDVVVLLGEADDREAPLAALIGDRNGSRPEDEVYVTSDGVGLFDEFARVIDYFDSMKTEYPEGQTGRIVVADLTGGVSAEYERALDAIANRGMGYGWSLLLLVTSLEDLPSNLRGELEVEMAWIYALGPVECTEENGVMIATALRAGVRSPRGIREVLAGAPIEWVAAYEGGEALGWVRV